MEKVTICLIISVYVTRVPQQFALSFVISSLFFPRSPVILTSAMKYVFLVNKLNRLTRLQTYSQILQNNRAGVGGSSAHTLFLISGVKIKVLLFGATRRKRKLHFLCLFLLIRSFRICTLSVLNILEKWWLGRSRVNVFIVCWELHFIALCANKS